MIDYFLKWTNQAAAKADALMLADYLGADVQGVSAWLRDRTLPDVQVWRPSQDNS